MAALYVGPHLDGPAAAAPRPPLRRRLAPRRLRLGRDRRDPPRDRRGARGDHDDHAQLDRDLRRRSTSFELGGPLQGDEPIDPALRRHPRLGEALDDRERAPAAPRRASSSRSPRSSSTHLLLNRTTLGYEVRAVGFNPEAARYGGISVGRNYFLALAISGRVRRARRRRRPARLEVPRRDERPRRRRDRLHRHRGRAARPQQGGRDPLRRAALRRAAGRHLDRASSTRTSSRRSSPATWRR